MKLANINEWEIPRSQSHRKFRQTYYAMTPEGTENESATSESESDDIPLAELARLKARKSRLKQENEGSSDKKNT